MCTLHSRNDHEDKLCARLTVYGSTSQESDLQQFSQKASLPQESDLQHFSQKASPPQESDLQQFSQESKSASGIKFHI